MQRSHQESGRITPCQFVPTDGWPEVGLSLLNQDCSHVVFFPTQMVLWKRCSVTQWLCNAPGSSGDPQYNPNAPHFKAPTWLFVFASTLKYWPLLPNCSLGLPTVDPWPTGAQQRVTVTAEQGSPCSHGENLPTPPHSEVVPWKGH